MKLLILLVLVTFHHATSASTIYKRDTTSSDGSAQGSASASLSASISASSGDGTGSSSVNLNGGSNSALYANADGSYGSGSGYSNANAYGDATGENVVSNIVAVADVAGAGNYNYAQQSPTPSTTTTWSPCGIWGFPECIPIDPPITLPPTTSTEIPSTEAPSTEAPSTPEPCGWGPQPPCTTDEPTTTTESQTETSTTIVISTESHSEIDVVFRDSETLISAQGQTPGAHADATVEVSANSADPGISTLTINGGASAGDSGYVYNAPPSASGSVSASGYGGVTATGDNASGSVITNDEVQPSSGQASFSYTDQA